MVRLSGKDPHQATEIHVPSGAHADVNRLARRVF